MYNSKRVCFVRRVQDGVYEFLAEDGVLYREVVSAATKRRRTI